MNEVFIPNSETPLIRPEWNERLTHLNEWQMRDITIVICERDTADVTKLCLESILRFYPDIPILIVDGGSVDESLDYVRMLAVKNPNVKVWERVGRNGHGTMLDGAIRGFIRTKYVLLCDNDIIVNRGGWIERMLECFYFADNLHFADNTNQPIYALGSLMLVTNSGDACGLPKDSEDVLRYTHPSCSMVNRETYLTLHPFVEHGAPLVYNMQDAQQKGLRIEYFPIEKYISHLSGASWTNPYRTSWRDDMDIMIRPFFTFIVRDVAAIVQLQRQTYMDFEILIEDTPKQSQIHIFNVGNKEIYNGLFHMRFKVHGEYVCRLGLLGFMLSDDHLHTTKRLIIAAGLPDEYDTNGIKFIKRRIWQGRDATL